jgi:hypothetical protein
VPRTPSGFEGRPNVVVSGMRSLDSIDGRLRIEGRMNHSSDVLRVEYSSNVDFVPKRHRNIGFDRTFFGSAIGKHHKSKSIRCERSLEEGVVLHLKERQSLCFARKHKSPVVVARSAEPRRPLHLCADVVQTPFVAAELCAEVDPFMIHG